MRKLSVLVSATLLFSSQPVLGGEFSQQGWKLVGSEAIGDAHQGASVALSSDGNTAIVGGPDDDGGKGAAWVYTRSSTGDWTQQKKLVGSEAIGDAHQGTSVALSSDGNTAIVGGPDHDGGTGAAWVYTRSGVDWTQQKKLIGFEVIQVGMEGIGDAHQGWSVSLSADGDTAIVGGPYAHGSKGAAWVFTRSGVDWTQQKMLVGTEAVGKYSQGWSVSLSGDGNIAIVGGPEGPGSIGAAWVFARSGGQWTQQEKLVGTGAIQSATEGTSVSLSSDSNTAIVGGAWDDLGIGAAWVYTRGGEHWTQQGNKLVGSGANSGPMGEMSLNQGWSVSLSGDGNTAIVGGPSDNGATGAVWVYTRGGEHWTQQGNKLVGSGAIGGASQGTSVALSSDGNTAIVGGPDDDGGKGAAWVYWTPPPPPPWLREMAVDPMALILNGRALEIWYQIKHPHVPKVAEIQQVLRSMTLEEQKATLNRAKTLANYGKQRVLRSMTPQEQKAALNRARILGNYAKDVEEAFATMQ